MAVLPEKIIVSCISQTDCGSADLFHNIAYIEWLCCRSSLVRSLAYSIRSFVRLAASWLDNATALSLYPSQCTHKHTHGHTHTFTHYTGISVVLFHRSTSISMDMTENGNFPHTHTKSLIILKCATGFSTLFSWADEL